MTVIQSFKESLSYYYEQFKILIFGENNARLDKLIVRFYSMREDQRVQVKKLAIVGGISLFFLVLLLYFYGLFRLQNNLDNAGSAYLQIQELKPHFILTKNEYTQISGQIIENNSIDNLISAVNQVATDLNVQIDDLPSTPIVTDLSGMSGLSSQFQKAKIDFRITGISLKKLTDFLNNIHKLSNKFSVKKLEITQVLGNKLYFNATVSLEAFVPKQPKG